MILMCRYELVFHGRTSIPSSVPTLAFSLAAVDEPPLPPPAATANGGTFVKTAGGNGQVTIHMYQLLHTFPWKKNMLYLISEMW